MKKIIFTTTCILILLINLQTPAQPINTTDVLVSAEVNIDQFNPGVFVNPWNPDEVITSTQHFDHILQGQIVFFELTESDFFSSANAGQSWAQGTDLFNKNSNLTGPSVQVDQDGKYYVNYCDGNVGMFMAWSDDQGNTWNQKTLKAQPDQVAYSISTPAMHIDNSQRSLYKGNIYSAWRFIAYESSDYCIEFTKSNYGSEQWSSPANICVGDEADATFEQTPVIRTGPAGEVYVCWMNHDNGPHSGENSIGFNRSFDGGETFGFSWNIQSDIKGLSGNSNLVGLDLISAPDMAVDISGGPHDGKIYIVWANVGVPGVNTGQDVDIYMITSDSWGSGWSAPIKVNQDPVGLSKEHFMPAITCDPETGTVTVIYYDNRDLGSNMLEVWGSISYDGGNTFTDFQISDVAMNTSTLISPDGNIGETIDVSAANGTIVPVWTDFRSQYCLAVSSAFNEKPVAKPDDFHADVIDWDNGAVLLTWIMEDPAGVQHYNIYRDNELIGTTNDLEFQENLSDYGNFTYRVTAQFNSMESAPETDFLQWGEGSLSFNFNEFDVKLAPGTSTTYVLRMENDGTIPVDYAFSVDHDPNAEIPMDGGADDFGYQWKDSDNPGGPGFDYIDITETGVEITGIQNDNYVGPFPIGFSFPFYDYYYNEFYISSNGLITFDGSFSNPTNSPIPIADGNNNFIAWCWDDLQKKSGGQVFYQEFEDYIVIQFKDYAQNGTLNLRYVINAEVILYKTGDIVIQYLDYTPGLFQTNSCSIGIENSDGSDGLQVAYNQSFIHDELAVRFFNPGVKWIESEFPYGTIEPGETHIQTVEFRSLDLPFGDYFANLNFITNAFATPQFTIPAKLEITNYIPERPQNLDYELNSNDLTLIWDAPSAKSLLGYNVYDHGLKVNGVVITDTEFLMENLQGPYMFQVTAVYPDGESNPEGDPMFVWVNAAASQQVQVQAGWSGISSWVVPDEPSVESMFAQMGYDLVLMMGDDGIYWPGQNINTIGNWNTKAGYKIKSAAGHEIQFSGTELSLPNMYCDEGWNIIPVLANCDVAPGEIFAYGYEYLVIIKEIAGTKVFWPAMNIMTLNYLNPGKAYEINLSGDASLYFPSCDKGGGDPESPEVQPETPWNDVTTTATSHTVAITVDAVTQLLYDDIIGVFNADGLCVGVAEYTNAPFALTVFGDDVSTEEIDGMQEGEQMIFKLYRAGDDEVFALEAGFIAEMPNHDNYTTNGLSGINTLNLIVTGTEDAWKTHEMNIYPNPSKGLINISLPNVEGQAEVKITNLHGQVVKQCNIPGDFDLQLELDVPSGIYFVTAKGNFQTQTKRILIGK